MRQRIFLDCNNDIAKILGDEKRGICSPNYVTKQSTGKMTYSLYNVMIQHFLSKLLLTLWMEDDSSAPNSKHASGDETQTSQTDTHVVHSYGLASSRAQIIKMFVNALKHNNIPSCVCVVPEPLKSATVEYLKNFDNMNILYQLHDNISTQFSPRNLNVVVLTEQ